MWLNHITIYSKNEREQIASYLWFVRSNNELDYRYLLAQKECYEIALLFIALFSKTELWPNNITCYASTNDGDQITSFVSLKRVLPKNITIHRSKNERGLQMVSKTSVIK